MTVHVFNHRLSPPHLNYLAPQQQRAAKRCLRHFTSLVFGRRRGDFPLKPPCLRARNLLASSGAWKIAPGPLVPLSDKLCRASGAVSFSARPPPPDHQKLSIPREIEPPRTSVLSFSRGVDVLGERSEGFKVKLRFFWIVAN